MFNLTMNTYARCIKQIWLVALKLLGKSRPSTWSSIILFVCSNRVILSIPVATARSSAFTYGLSSPDFVRFMSKFFIVDDKMCCDISSVIIDSVSALSIWLSNCWERPYLTFCWLVYIGVVSLSFFLRSRFLKHVLSTFEFDFPILASIGL